MPREDRINSSWGWSLWVLRSLFSCYSEPDEPRREWPARQSAIILRAGKTLHPSVSYCIFSVLSFQGWGSFLGRSFTSSWRMLRLVTDDMSCSHLSVPPAPGIQGQRGRRLHQHSWVWASSGFLHMVHLLLSKENVCFIFIVPVWCGSLTYIIMKNVDSKKRSHIGWFVCDKVLPCFSKYLWLQDGIILTAE